MSNPPALRSEVELLAGSILRLAFSGVAGEGSYGNTDGAEMTAVVRRALEEYRPAGLILDLRELEYRWGDWIGGPALTAAKWLGRDRVCLVAAGETLEALRGLWSHGLNRIVPLGSSMEEALAHLARGE